MPIGKVKWYDAEKGFGFVSNPGDEDVYVGRNVLPKGVEELFPGQRIDFDFAAGPRRRPVADSAGAQFRPLPGAQDWAPGSRNPPRNREGFG